MKKAIYFLCVLLVLGLMSCTSQEQPNENTEEQTTEEQTAKTSVGSMKWSFETVDKAGAVKTNVFVATGDKKHMVLQEQDGNFVEVDKATFADFQIPDDAIIACQNYWAGTLTVIYAKKEGAQLLIKTGYKYDDDGADAKVIFEEEMKIE